MGERIQFRIDVTNTGDQALDNVTITDRFDASLEHAEGLTSPIQKLIGQVGAGADGAVRGRFLRAQRRARSAISWK